MGRKGGTRSKAGCQTCRRRHKKCDERKPICWNCERSNIECGGFTRPIKWKLMDASDIQRKYSSDTPLPPQARHYASPNDKTPSPSSITLQQNPATIRAHVQVAAEALQTPYCIPHVRVSDNEMLLQYFVEVISPILVGSTDKRQSSLSQLIIPMASSDGNDWGLLDIILSLSASHRIRTRSDVSSYSLQSDRVQALEMTKWEHYGRAMTKHSRNLSCVMQEPNDRLTCIDYTIATTMLLSQWSTCEKGDALTCKLHLSAASDLVSRKIDGILRNGGLIAFQKLSKASRMLLEWFYFCDTMASVTSNERSGFLNIHGSAANILLATLDRRPPSEILWVGTNDGLFRLLARTLTLRRATAAANQSHRAGCLPAISFMPHDPVGVAWWTGTPSSFVTDHGHTLSVAFSDQPSQPVSDIVSNMPLEAISIENALSDWSFVYPNPQQCIIGAAYRWAISLILLFTIDPYCPIQNHKVQQILYTLGQLLHAISPTDSTQTSALFPLFMYGVTVFHSHQRRLVINKLTEYSQWTGLGHAEDIIYFLQGWWAEQELEAGKNIDFPRDWWAWERYVKLRDIHLMLT